MKKLKFKHNLVILLFAFALYSCGNNEPATPINAEQFSKLYENKENSNKRFSITGFPFLDKDVTVRNNMKISVSIYSEANGKGENIASVNMRYKEYKNGMYIPDNFTAEDLQIFDNEGNQFGVNDKITVSFTMDLNTNRPPSKERTSMGKVNGKMQKIIIPAQYYGNGPKNLKIEKSKE